MREAADEDKEDDTPAALLLTSDKSRHRCLIVNPAEDKTLEIGRHVTLLWSNASCIRVWRRGEGGAETLLSSGTTMLLNGPTYLRIEPLAVSSDNIRFTAYGEEDDYGGKCVEDSVSAFTYDLELSCVKFNHNTSSTATDGINLRPSRDVSFNISNGEWNSVQGAVAPICYRINQPVTVKAKFRTTSTVLRTAQIQATGEVNGVRNGCLCSFGAQTVSFNGGETQDITFAMEGTTPSSIALFEQERLVWGVSRINGETRATELTIANSGPHRVYVILGDPVSPWSNAPNNNQNIWTSSLDFIMPVVESMSNARQVLTAMTQHFFSDMGFRYNLGSGGAAYSDIDDVWPVSQSYFMVTAYAQKQYTLVNCVDQSGALVTFGRLLGVQNVKALHAHPFGYINTVNLIGVGMCNNPSGSGALICGDDDLSRAKFISHTFVQYDGLVFDATIGPIKGMHRMLFLYEVIDKSTTEELEESLFTPAGHEKPYVFSEVFNQYGLE